MRQILSIAQLWLVPITIKYAALVPRTERNAIILQATTVVRGACGAEIFLVIK